MQELEQFCNTERQREILSEVMDSAHNASLAYALGLWADWMRNDFAEIRTLWYPAKSMVLEPRQSVTESSDIEHEDDIEHRIVIEVNNAIINLTASQRVALERSLGMAKTVGYAASIIDRLEPAYRAFVENHYLGVTVKPRRVTEESLGGYIAGMYEIDLSDAQDRIWRHILAMGCI